MAGVNAATSISDALRDQRVAGIVEAQFRSNEVIGLFPMRPFTGGATINVTMHYAGNTSVGTYQEGDAPVEAGSQSYLTAQWGAAYYRGVISFTGHAEDQLMGGSLQAAFYDQIGQEMDRCMVDITHAIATDMLGTGLTAPVGMLGIIDSTGTIAGLSRSTYTWFASFEGSSLSSSTVITVADIDSAQYQTADPPYEGRVSAIWTSLKQSAALKNVIGNAGVSNSPVRQDAGAAVNAGNVLDPSYVGGLPIRKIRGLDNSVWLGVSESEFFIGDMRSWKVDELAKVDDSRKFQITRAVGLGCMNPRRNWKLTGYTT